MGGSETAGVGTAWITLAIVCLILFTTTDDRFVARVADGRQMVFSAVALTEAGTLGQAPGRDLTVPRSGGDSVSRFGLGMTFAQVPAAALAPLVEARLGAGTSQPLFLVAPFLCVLACAWFAGAIAVHLGAGPVGRTAAILLATIASPFASYAAMELSEPLQALGLTAAFAFSLRARDEPAPVTAALAGVCVGIAVLTKSSLLAVAPFALLPLLTAPRRRGLLLGAASVGLLPLLGLWLDLEFARFGRPLAGYAGEGFTHPFFDGAWRLTIGVNKGFFLYFPAGVVAVLAAVARAFRPANTRGLKDSVSPGLKSRATGTVLVAPVLVFAALFALAAPWWAWHGVDGWGPRLIVPAIPLLAAIAAVEIARWPKTWRVALIALSIAINVLPLLQHPTPVVRYEWASAWPVVDAKTAAGVPAFAKRAQPDGTIVIPPDQILSSVPSASPFVLLPWFFRASFGDAAHVAECLNQPPWLGARPDIHPVPPISAEEAVTIARPPRINFWGRSFFGLTRDPSIVPAYDAALQNQLLRAQHLRDRDVALALARKLESIAPDGFADALMMETYRLLGRKADAIDFLQHLPMERRAHPAINIVLALWDRDDGKEAEARALLQTSAPSYPGTPVEHALTAPLSAWPSDFAGMTEDLSIEVQPQAR